MLCYRSVFWSNPDWTSRNKRGVSLPAVLVLFRILHLTSVFLIDTQNKYCGQIAELYHILCVKICHHQCKNLTKERVPSLWKLRMCHFGSSPNTRMCRNDHLEKVLVLWLSLLPNIDQAACRAQTRGENMAGVYERRNSSIWFNLLLTLFLFARQTPGVRLLGTLHCRARENNWKNTLYTSYSHQLTKRFANQLLDVNKECSSNFCDW